MSDNNTDMDGKEVKEENVVTEEVIQKASNVTTPSETVPTEVKTENELSSLNYSSFDTPAKMLALGEVLCKSKLVPLKSPQDVMTALMTGKELGLPFITSVSQIYPINGRPTLGIHIQKALCLKNGIIFEKVEDAVSIYQFAQKDENGKVITKDVQTKEGIKKVPIIVHTGTMEERPDNTAFSEITKRTKYKVTRYIKIPTGEFKEVVAYGSFTLQEAQDAELFSKDVWVKYWRRMLDARALSNAIREIASDITLGLYTPNELDGNVTITDDGIETIDVEVIKD